VPGRVWLLISRHALSLVMFVTCYDEWSLLAVVCHVSESCPCIFTRGRPLCLQVKLGWIRLGCVSFGYASLGMLGCRICMWS
jgi:hypothetical protein